LRRPAWVWLFTLIITFLTLAISVALLQQVQESGVISYEMGNWAPPWGIEYRVDFVNAFVLLIVSIIGAVVTIYAGKSVTRELPEHKQTLFYVAYLLCLAGLLGIIITGDAFNVFVFLEISSLSTYTLVSLGSDRRALTAAFQYLVMGTLGATFILIGIGLMYMMTGTLNMMDLADRLPAVSDTRTIHAAFAFFTVGVSLKLALFPLHLWLPNSYAYAPSAASAMLAATATKVAIYVMLRFVFTIYGANFSFEILPLGTILMVMAIPAILVGSTVAIYQDNIKRMLAYSSVAQIGYMILGISFASLAGVTSGILHLFNHALMKGGLFLALGGIFYHIGATRLENFRGLGQTMPWTMAAVVLGGLSLIGVPLTVGFVSKWYLVLAALEAGAWYIAVIVLVGSVLAVIYIWRLVEAAYFSPPAENASVREAPLQMLIPTWLLIGASVYFGINTDLTVGVATRAAVSLLGITP
jgi:multicomponent Na+:H+ antiporter subunit D